MRLIKGLKNKNRRWREHHDDPNEALSRDKGLPLVSLICLVMAFSVEKGHLQGPLLLTLHVPVT